ncbi:lipase/esterase [Weissella oryzae SG25]|uniref:Lipase/esterase n=1 Tax=Weissella oryzae (strain DSM 25784 / JCM 18191 / LMG 30913 / SG25) TaxID=1329250 RepID=A0A069D363_WEIOS|nr:alpha/beta hydrolase [Weissella oryzae]GAK31811.1 lipase/esterase [Weissella oryzae SG25]
MRASLEELKDLTKAMILNGQADVLRDEGKADVDVTQIRFRGVMLTQWIKPMQRVPQWIFQLHGL